MKLYKFSFKYQRTRAVRLRQRYIYYEVADKEPQFQVPQQSEESAPAQPEQSKTLHSSGNVSIHKSLVLPSKLNTNILQSSYMGESAGMKILMKMDIHAVSIQCRREGFPSGQL
jgi:hypothetical protein